ncbi:P-loop containing nucleoside triphosphate hydrolase protein [Aspergillus crustosus]
MTVLSIFALMGAPLNLLAQTSSGLFTGIACIERIREFLVSVDRSGDQDEHRSTSSTLENPFGEKQKPPIKLTDTSLGWNKEEPVLSGLSLVMKEATLTVIVGPVGCGKSTLLKGLVRENLLLNGSLSIDSSTIAYCNQTPWITNATLRGNIVGCTPYSQSRYEEVLQCCSLAQDIDNLPHGDQTVLGSGGSAISGGQRQRVPTARAVYSTPPITVLDDVLSGLDANTEQHILHNLLSREWLLHRQRRTVVLASSFRAPLAIADQIIWLDSTGRISDHETILEPAPVTPQMLQLSGPRSTLESNVSTDAPTLEDAFKRRTGDWVDFQYYVLRTGRSGMVGFLVMMTIFVFLFNFPSVWDELCARSTGNQLEMYVGVYYTIAAVQTVSIVVAAIHLLLYLVPRAAINFHRILLNQGTPILTLLRDPGRPDHRTGIRGQSFYKDRLRAILVHSQRPFYTLLCVQHWLALVLDLTVAGLAVLLAGIAVAVRGLLSTGLVSLALVNLIVLNTNVKLLVMQWTMLETSISALVGEDQAVPADWPSRGGVEIMDASARYSDEGLPVLNKISLSIPPGPKVDICGRSGRRPRHLHPPPKPIRSQINAIPQFPFFLPGSTIRACINPYATLNDTEITHILREVQLWDVLGATNDSLDLAMSESLLSHGQRQLLSLARALARRSSTAVVHRLETIVDYDLVAVLEQGRVVESGPPGELLARSTSAFRRLYETQRAGSGLSGGAKTG